MDAFTVNWGDKHQLVVPPVGLVSRLVQHATKTKALETLIVPQWISAPFWPILFPEGSPAVFVQAVVQLPQVDWGFDTG